VRAYGCCGRSRRADLPRRGGNGLPARVTRAAWPAFHVTFPRDSGGKVALNRARAGAVRCGARGRTQGAWFGRAARSWSDLTRACSPAGRKRLRYGLPGLRSISRADGFVRLSTIIRDFRTKPPDRDANTRQSDRGRPKHRERCDRPGESPFCPPQLTHRADVSAIYSQRERRTTLQLSWKEPRGRTRR